MAVEKKAPSVRVMAVVSSSSVVAMVVLGATVSVEIFMNLLSTSTVRLLMLTFYCNPIYLCYGSRLCSGLRIYPCCNDVINTRVFFGRA